ncbi:MAG: dihydrofolate reductase family protein, partial [Armatimonadetes bacterium]|nr:dihydrofolate reductase family protein [Armatimonadota bacterium]
RDGRVDLEVLLHRLAERGVVEVLSEAGGTVTGGLFAAGLVDRVVAFIAPKLVGGRGPTPWDEAGRETMAAAVRLEQVEMERCGDDLLVTGRVGRE